MEKLTPQLKGTITELEVATEFMKNGITVSKPLVDARYDYIIDLNGELKTVQVKTSRLSKDGNCVVFNTSNTHTNTKGTFVRNYKNDNVDYFATYYDGVCYVVPVGECGSRERRLRILPTANNQAKGICFLEDYRLEKILLND